MVFLFHGRPLQQGLIGGAQESQRNIAALLKAHGVTAPIDLTLKEAPNLDPNCVMGRTVGFPFKTHKPLQLALKKEMTKGKRSLTATAICEVALLACTQTFSMDDCFLSSPQCLVGNAAITLLDDGSVPVCCPNAVKESYNRLRCEGYVDSAAILKMEGLTKVYGAPILLMNSDAMKAKTSQVD